MSVFEWQAYDEREIAWRKAFILFEYLTYPYPIVFVVSVSALHDPIIFVPVAYPNIAKKRMYK